MSNEMYPPGTGPRDEGNTLPRLPGVGRKVPSFNKVERYRTSRARVMAFPGIGHAPALMADDQIAAIESWLSEQT